MFFKSRRRMALFTFLQISNFWLNRRQLDCPIHFCIQSVGLSHSTSSLENSIVHLWENESEKANNILVLLWKVVLDLWASDRVWETPWGSWTTLWLSLLWNLVLPWGPSLSWNPLTWWWFLSSIAVPLGYEEAVFSLLLCHLRPQSLPKNPHQTVRLFYSLPLLFEVIANCLVIPLFLPLKL